MNQEIIPWARFPDGVDPMHVLHLIAQQINKDAGGEWVRLNELEKQPSPETLYREVRGCVDALCDQDLPALVRLFYRVDLPEKKVNEVITREAPEKLVDHLTWLLVQREAMKVAWRLSSTFES